MIVLGGLTIAETRREVKDKREKERYIHLNAEFQRIARKDEKAFLSEQAMQRDRGQQQNWKDKRSLQENQRYQRNISCNYGHNKGQKWYGSNRIKKD